MRYPASLGPCFFKITQPNQVGTAPGGGSPGGAAGGDLSGGYPGPTVVGIQGVPVCVTAPSLNDVLTFDGTDWCPTAPGGGGLGNVTDVAPESPQIQRYLQRDGSWRNPLVAGTGTISVGAISTLTDNSLYNAWPTVCRMTNGTLIAAYTAANCHHCDNSGVAVGKLGVEGLNGTITWGTEFTIYDHASLWASIMGVGSMHTGRVFATLFRDNAGAGGTGEAGLVYSDDFGTTWSAWISLTSAFSQESFGAGPVVELPNGDLLVTVEGTDSGTYLNRSSRSLRSTDQGLTWGGVVTIAAYGARPYYESKLVLLNDDTLLCVHRTSAGTGTCYTNTSSDGGLTWTTPVSAFSGYGAPSTIQLSTGTLIAFTRRNSDAAEIAYTSTDHGVTWSSAIVLDATVFESEYGCPVELLDGRILGVYTSQPTSSTTNADVKLIYLTETTTPISASITIKDEGTPLTTAATSLDFVGGGVVASGTGVGKTITISGAPTGSAGGDLSGTYPNPTINASAITALLPPAHAHVNNVTFSGDGSTTIFILPVAPVDAYSIGVYVGTGRNNDWALSGGLLDTLTFGSAPASGTDNISVDICAAL